ncbi:MAG: AsmA family protein [Terriglobales bacterium]
MKRKALIVLVSIAAVLALLFAVVPLLINAERFRPTLEQRMGEALDRQVRIGHLRFSWFAGGIQAQNITVADDPAFGTRPFLTAQALEVKVELRPLIFDRQVNIESILVREPEVLLIENRGKWNISTLGARREPRRPQPAAATPLTLRQVTITNGRVVIQSGGALQTYTGVNLKAQDVSTDAAFPVTLAVHMPGDADLDVSGTVGPLGSNAALFPFDLKTKLAHLDLAKSGYVGKDAGPAGLIDAETALKCDGRTVREAGTLSLKNAVFVKGGAPVAGPIDLSFAGDYDLVARRGTLSRGHARFRQSSADLTGSFDTRSPTLAVSMNLATSGFLTDDLNALLPAMAVVLPRGVALRGGTVSTTLALAGPADRLVSRGPLNLRNITVSGFDLGGAMRAIAALAGVNTGRDTQVRSLDTNVRVTPSGIAFDDLKADVVGLGTIDGRGNVGADQSLSFQLVAHLAQKGGLLGGLMTATGVGQLSTVPFRIQGTTTNPQVVPDVGSIIQTQKPQPGQQQQQQPANPFGGLFDQLLNKKK